MKSLLVVLIILVAQFGNACVGPKDVLEVYLGKGTPGVEEIKVTVKYGESNTQKTVTIEDDDGYGNLLLMTSLVKNLSDEKIKTLQIVFLNSLNKAINFYERQMQLDQVLIDHPAANPISTKHARERYELYNILGLGSRKVALEVTQNGLTRKSFGSLVLGVVDGRAPSYQYSELDNGVFVKRGEKSLLDIIGKRTYISAIASITHNGNYLPARGCGASGVLVE